MAQVSFDQVVQFAKTHEIPVNEAVELFKKNGDVLSPEDQAKLASLGGEPDEVGDKANFAKYKKFTLNGETFFVKYSGENPDGSLRLSDTDTRRFASKFGIEDFSIDKDGAIYTTNKEDGQKYLVAQADDFDMEAAQKQKELQNEMAMAKGLFKGSAIGLGATLAAAFPPLAAALGVAASATACTPGGDNVYENVNIANVEPTNNVTIVVKSDTPIDQLIKWLDENFPEVINQLKKNNALLAEIVKNQNISNEQLQQLITKLGDYEGYFIQIIDGITESNVNLTAIHEDAVKAGDLLAEIKAILQKMGNDVSSELKEILLAVLNNGEKIDSVTELLNKIHQDVIKNKEVNEKILEVVSKLGPDVVDGLNFILDAIKNNHLELTNELNTILDAILKATEQDDNWLNKILEAIHLNTEQGKANAKAIIDAIEKLGVNVMSGLTAILNAINEGDENAQALLEKLLAAVKENTATSKQNAKDIIAAIEKLGVDMSAGFVKVLAQGEAGQALMKEILDAIKNLKIENGSNYEAALSAILNAINGNGQQLKDITELLKTINNNVVKNGEEGRALGREILEAIKKLGADNQDIINYLKAITQGVNNGNVKLDKIIELLGKIEKNGNETNIKLGDLNVKADAMIAGINAILEKLDDLKNGILNEIKVAIEDHDVKVTVDVTGKVQCECNCSGHNPNEGIITELENLFN